MIAAGRNPQTLDRLGELGADATVRLDQPNQDLTGALAAAAGDSGIQVIIDYLWGRPTEALLAASMRRGLTQTAPRVRLVQVGDSAGPTASPARYGAGLARTFAAVEQVGERCSDARLIVRVPSQRWRWQRRSRIRVHRRPERRNPRRGGRFRRPPR